MVLFTRKYKDPAFDTAPPGWYYIRTLKKGKYLN